jgi:hypothetical protein
MLREAVGRTAVPSARNQFFGVITATVSSGLPCREDQPVQSSSIWSMVSAAMVVRRLPTGWAGLPTTVV